MAVNVKSCYLYLLDNVHQMFMPTERPLDETVDGAYHFLEKNIVLPFEDIDPGKRP